MLEYLEDTKGIDFYLKKINKDFDENFNNLEKLILEVEKDDIPSKENFEIFLIGQFFLLKTSISLIILILGNYTTYLDYEKEMKEMFNFKRIDIKKRKFNDLGKFNIDKSLNNIIQKFLKLSRAVESLNKDLDYVLEQIKDKDNVLEQIKDKDNGNSKLV